MFWLRYEIYRGSGRLSRSWIVEADFSPAKPDECDVVSYPFNGMGGFVFGSFDSWEEAVEAEYVLWGDIPTERHRQFPQPGPTQSEEGLSNE